MDGKKSIIYALVIHIFLLCSIFVIYFRSPVITGQSPQKSLTEFGFEPPAKRLVLIVTDGLRAESFFHNNCTDIPSIKNIILKKGGILGVSHTHVPTESRPGHIALIAGLYEDPSAVTRGWKENPIDFDNVFNRSDTTFAWGAYDILHIFSRIGKSQENLYIDAYDHEIDFSGRSDTFALDEWVFEKVKKFLDRKGHEIQNKQKVIFFLHLLGLDSAGHVHKPGSKLFLQNLLNTDRGINKVYEHFEKTFPDTKTAYILTSDHGMTNTGAHGAGDPTETETPFFLWGAGINCENIPATKSIRIEHHQIPLHEIEQAQMAPLMSTILGLPPPMNNFGMLPYKFLNTSEAYKAHAAYNNALQLIGQYETLLYQHQKGIFTKFLRSFKKLQKNEIISYKKRMDSLILQHLYGDAINLSTTIMNDALEGIDYYHGYYRNVILGFTATTFIGWIYYLIQLLLEITKPIAKRTTDIRLYRIIFAIGICLLLFILLQRVPLVIGIYFLLPLFVATLIVERIDRTKSITKKYNIPVGQSALILFCAELLAYTFFERRLISVCFLIFGFLNNFNSFTTKRIQFFYWLGLLLSVACFPLLPLAVGQKNANYLFLALFLVIMRGIFVKTQLNWKTKMIRVICIINTLLCIYLDINSIVIPIVSRIASWIFLAYTLICNVIYPANTLKEKLEFIFFNFSLLYTLLSTSYESLFVIMLASELVIGLSAQDSTQTIINTSIAPTKNSTDVLQKSFRYAYAILLYTFISFFGTGNIASVSSFDPNIVRFFLTTFSPFTIMALVILKLFIPVILNITIIFGLSSFARIYEREIFICLLLMCDLMGLNFLFLVKNKGSWLEIGSSISHFVIMEVTTVILLIITYLAKFILNFNNRRSFVKIQ